MRQNLLLTRKLSATGTTILDFTVPTGNTNTFSKLVVTGTYSDYAKINLNGTNNVTLPAGTVLVTPITKLTVLEGEVLLFGIAQKNTLFDF
jgi:hypothetical protein